MYSKFPVAQGSATIFQSVVRLKNEENGKSRFSIFVL